MNLPELSDNEMAVLQTCMSLGGVEGVHALDSREISLQARSAWGLDQTVDLQALLKRLVDLGYLTIATEQPMDPKAEPSRTPYYRISPSGRGRVVSHGKGGK